MVKQLNPNERCLCFVSKDFQFVFLRGFQTTSFVVYLLCPGLTLHTQGDAGAGAARREPGLSLQGTWDWGLQGNKSFIAL